MKKNLSLVTEPNEFFREMVIKVLEGQKIKVDPHTEFYLVQLLSKFIVTENFFQTDENGSCKEEVLALLLKEALQAVNVAHQQRELRRLGDISLYTAGFFSDSLSRKTVDIDYYIGMGKNAYSHLAQMDSNVYFPKVFGELSERFHKFVDVFAEISTTTGTMDSQNILRTYEIWLKTRSERAEKNLKEAGIIPNAFLKPLWQ